MDAKALGLFVNVCKQVLDLRTTRAFLLKAPLTDRPIRPYGIPRVTSNTGIEIWLILRSKVASATHGGGHDREGRGGR